MADPPEGRVEEQQRLHQHLQKVHQRVVSPNVGQFVCNDNPQLLYRRAGHDRHRQQQNRPDQPDDCGYAQAIAHHDSHPSTQS